jgi:hypothetical protein
MRWLIVPFAFVGALLAGVFSPPRRRSAAEVVRYLREFIDGTGGEWDWDEFESIPIADPALESIRTRAAQAGPPHPNIQELARLLTEAEDLARQDANVA